jgi:hypothetical protein
LHEADWIRLICILSLPLSRNYKNTQYSSGIEVKNTFCLFFSANAITSVINTKVFKALYGGIEGARAAFEPACEGVLRKLFPDQ